jgi:sialate O-acetylesterase
MKQIFFLSAVTMAVSMATAAVETASPFADGMVLQRDMKVPVWGWADPGEKVSVSFAGKTCTAVASADGKWRVDLPPMKASKESRELRVNDRVFKDVLVGEVWYCSGQSNMQLALVSENPRSRDRNGSLVAQMTYRPFIRFVQMKSGVKMTPQAKAAHPVVWRDFRPETLREGFSALATYYALELYAALDVPIGMVGVYRAGSRLEPWVPNEGFRAVPELKDFVEYKPAEGKAFSKDALLALCPNIIKRHLTTIFQPSVHWNAVVEPWAPYAGRGMLWYQGEANAADGDIYAKKMHALYRGWAQRFENPSFRLYFVQLAPHGKGPVELQKVQARFADEEPNAAMAVITDLGNNSDIHPNEKEFVAKRLVLHALRKDYGFSDIKSDSPAFDSFEVTGSNVVVRLRNAEKLYIYNKDFSMSTGFELAGADGVWKKAKVTNLKKKKWSNGKEFLSGEIEGDGKIVLSAEGVSAPSSVRYLHASPFFGSVYNEVDLPLGPFSASR